MFLVLSIVYDDVKLIHFFLLLFRNSYTRKEKMSLWNPFAEADFGMQGLLAFRSAGIAIKLVIYLIGFHINPGAVGLMNG